MLATVRSGTTQHISNTAVITQGDKHDKTNADTNDASACSQLENCFHNKYNCFFKVSADKESQMVN
jgi:hypothetical protein